MAEWKTVKINQFLQERQGRFDPKDKAIKGLKRLDKIDFSGGIHLSDKDSKTDMIIIKPGDLVISGINVAKGALAVFHGDEPITATIHYSSYAFDEKKIDIDYFKRFVKSQSFVQTLKDQVKGGIKTEIKPKAFLPLEIQLPDIESQKEISSFFKNIENEMEVLSNEIDQQKSFFNKLRQQILQEAIEGKLTAKWREEHQELISGNNHASKLLKKIQSEKEQLIKEGKIKKIKPLSPISDKEKPFDLPEGWVWGRLGDVCSKIGSGSTPSGSNYSAKGIPFFRSQNIHNGGVVYEDIKYISADIHSHMSGTTVLPGDLLLNITGGSLGRCARVPFDFKEGNLSQHVCIIRVVQVNKAFLHDLIVSPLFQNMVFQSTTGAGREGLPKYNLEQFVIPLPPFAEEQAIVARVDKLMSLINELEKQVSEREDLSEKLMKSVLREAFAG